MKTILFDIDGTLLYTGGAGRIAFERVFEEMFGVAKVWQGLKPGGKTDPMLIQELCEQSIKRNLNQEESQEVVERYTRYFEEELKVIELFRLLPGIPHLLELIAKQENCVMGIATGNFERPAWAKLKKGKLDSYFKFGGFGSDSGDRTELTQKAIERGAKWLGSRFLKESVYLVGDTYRDVEVGKKLGVKTIAVATGRESHADLSKLNPDKVLEDFSDPKPFLSFIE